MASLEHLKLTAQSWDSDKNIPPFPRWANGLSSLVRATKNGEVLEGLIDIKVDRVSNHHVATPSFISEDPDFALSIEHQNLLNSTVSPPEGDSASVSSNATSAFQLPAAPEHLRMSQMPIEVIQHDRVLFNILRVNVKGSKATLLDLVSSPSYVQAMCILYKHHEISRNDRKVQAFKAMDALQYKGDVHKYQIESMDAVREVFDSKCSIMDYILSRVMKSFDGKSKTVQFKIAEDINSKVVNDKLNIFDMIQGYCADIASVGDGQPHMAKTATESDELCPYCKRGKHKESDCFKKQRDEAGAKANAHGNGNKNRNANSSKKYNCSKCGKKGHKARDCRSKPNQSGAKAEADGQANTAQVRLDVSKLSREQIADLIQSCKFATEQPNVSYSAVNSRFPIERQCNMLNVTASESDRLLQVPTEMRNSDAYVSAEGGSYHEPGARYVTAVPVLRSSAQGGHRGQRVGEASHPGPSVFI